MTTAYHRLSRLTFFVVITAMAAVLVGFGPSPQPFPDAWFYPDRATGKRHAYPKMLEGKPAPELKVRDWVGKKPDLSKLKGKVVVVDFWATWCGPCVRSIPKNTQLVDKYKDDGLVFIGVHDAKRGKERIPQVLKQLNVNYPVAVDDGGVSTRNWRVAFWPTYVIIDHNGIVRASGIMPHHVEDAVKKLIAERKADLG